MPLLNARWVRKLVRRGGIHYCRRHLAPTDAPVITRRSSLRVFVLACLLALFVVVD
eukprot:m.53643 g.53643  ORF g.53643 m.53643 type:complete len:56 (+) comp48607_c0_seq14:157-324(+)